MVYVDLGTGSPAAITQQLAFIENHDVMLEGKGGMVFLACHCHLTFIAEGKNIVADDIIPSVMLMETAVLGVIHQIIFQKHIGSSLVRVKPPAAVVAGIDIMDHIPAQDRSAGIAQSVNTAHIAQDLVAQMVDMIILHKIPL